MVTFPYKTSQRIFVVRIHYSKMYRMEILNFHTPKIYPILDVKLPDSCRCV